MVRNLTVIQGYTGSSQGCFADGAFPAQALIAILLLMSSLVRSHTLEDLARVVRKFLRLGDGQFPMWDLPVDLRAGASSFAAYIP
jgi:hypothetical protein